MRMKRIVSNEKKDLPCILLECLLHILEGVYEESTSTIGGGIREYMLDFHNVQSQYCHACIKIVFIIEYKLYS